MWLVLLLALLSSGCSTVKLAYNNAPGLGYWWLDSYLDLGEAQSLTVRTELAALQAWHRQSELPLYVSTLKTLQRLAPANVTAEQVCELSGELGTRFQTLVNQTAPAITTLAPSFKDEQLDHLARQFDKRNLKWRTEWLDGSPTERSARRLKQLTERFEMFYGPLEAPQLTLLRSRAAESTFDARVGYRENVRRQQDALQTLRALRAGNWTEPRVKAEVNAVLLRTLNSPDAAFKKYQTTLTQEGCKTFAALHNSTTPAQRRGVMETLKGYEADARILMASQP